MKKYLTIFKISLANELEYRIAFLLARTRNVIYLLLLYYVWLSLSQMTGRFAMYGAVELTTYVFGAHLLRSIIFGSQSRDTAREINDGIFSMYLLKPVSHFWYVFWKELAQRALFFLTAIIELIVFILLSRAHFLIQNQVHLIFFFAAAVFLALFLYFLMTYIVSLFAFWSREAMGPRFLFEWFLEFSSGAFFPLDILSKTLLVAFQFLPFAYLLYFPMKLYLGDWNAWQIATGISIQVLFIALMFFATKIIWKRGLKRYSGEGI